MTHYPYQDHHKATVLCITSPGRKKYSKLKVSFLLNTHTLTHKQRGHKSKCCDYYVLNTKYMGLRELDYPAQEHSICYIGFLRAVLQLCHGSPWLYSNFPPHPTKLGTILPTSCSLLLWANFLEKSCVWGKGSLKGRQLRLLVILETLWSNCRRNPPQIASELWCGGGSHQGIRSPIQCPEDRGS